MSGPTTARILPKKPFCSNRSRTRVLAPFDPAAARSFRSGGRKRWIRLANPVATAMTPPEPPPEDQGTDERVSVIRFDLINVALATAVVILVSLAFRFLSLVENVLVLLALAVILATAIEPLLISLRRLGFRRGYGVLIIYLIAVAALVVFLVIAAQAVLGQLVALIAALPTLQKQLVTVVGLLPAGALRDTALALLVNASTVLPQQGLASLLTAGTLSGLVFATLSVVEVVFAIVTILVVAYFWIAERLVIRRLVLRTIRPERRERALVIWESVENKLGAWARGQFLLMAMVGLIQGIGYAILGIPFALLLGVYAGLAEIVPILGPYLGAAPAVLVALSRSPQLALLVVAYTVVVNLIESNVLVPRIMEKAVGLSPLTVIVALLAGAELYGIVGAFLAVPIAAAIQAALVELATSDGAGSAGGAPGAGRSAC